MEIVSLCRLPDRVGGYMDSSVSSGRRVHQRYHPCNRRSLTEGQRHQGDRNRVDQ